MITIYCLVNPITNRPFYVGATKSNLSARLSAHINESKAILPIYWNRKNYLINYIISLNKRPIITPLHKCALFEVDHYEQLFYNVLTQQGFKLLQENSFNYSIKHRIGNIINQWDKSHPSGLHIVKRY